jgi:hypothetical protein
VGCRLPINFPDSDWNISSCSKPAKYYFPVGD